MRSGADRGHTRGGPAGERPGLETRVRHRIADRSGERHIIEEGIRSIARVVVIMAGQGQGVRVTRRDRGRDLDPGGGVGAGFSQNGAGGVTRIVLEGSGSPVIGDGIRAGDAVPEGERPAATGDSEGLANAAVTIGG